MKPFTKEFYTRFNLMNGKLELPGRAKFEEVIGKDYTTIAEAMFESMWNAYLRKGVKGSISLPYWSNKFNNAKVFNQVIMSLAKANWIETHSIPEKNWAEAFIKETRLLEIVTVKELEAIRAHNKFRKYLLTDAKPRTNNRVKRGKKTVKSGIVRDGFMKAGNTEFTYDKEMMIKYYDVILAQLVKSMDKIIIEYPELREDGASYREISIELLDYYINSDDKYSLGENISDSRGRAIYQILKKVFNPISNKEARALLIIPEENRLPTTKDAVKAYFLFIAELNGYKNCTIEEKEKYGKDCYTDRVFLDLDITSLAEDIINSDKHYSEKKKAIEEDNKKIEENRKKVYENIWLERIYNELDELFIDKNYKFKVPIEVDASASVLQYLGILLNHKPFMERTNLIGDTLKDAWTIEGINSRAQVKVIMRTIYGSVQECWQMWEDEGIEYTPEDIIRYNKELTEGSLAVANLFKEFIISSVKPKPTMKPVIWNDTFEIICNRFKQVGEKTISYDIYDSVTKLIKRIHHTETKSVEDLEQFRRYFITLLIFV